ncbi:ABC-three component system middle component 2 [uncultured Paludibaculum sp.]|uniref:ABC-three component system middle component 2 n=1 Tax=uncultured Paludibaculum sp. TaxID=1765020 RepID=UPI002AAB6085|nr:ABC-three component system middle component 2 [uncultured Paludibaculum sp.]
MAEAGVQTFNSPIETGMRALILLAESYPEQLDLQRILEFDYIMVHTGDVDGPPSIHPALPLRSGELLVRRQLIERGLMLMISRGLASRHATANGFMYQAEDDAGPFLDALTAEYLEDLKNRAMWVVDRFSEMSDHDIRVMLSQTYDQWSREFQLPEQPGLF